MSLVRWQAERSKVDIERVLVSPYLRAEQTLDIVGSA